MVPAGCPLGPGLSLLAWVSGAALLSDMALDAAPVQVLGSVSLAVCSFFPMEFAAWYLVSAMAWSLVAAFLSFGMAMWLACE